MLSLLDTSKSSTVCVLGFVVMSLCDFCHRERQVEANRSAAQRRRAEEDAEEDRIEEEARQQRLAEEEAARQAEEARLKVRRWSLCHLDHLPLALGSPLVVSFCLSKSHITNTGPFAFRFSLCVFYDRSEKYTGDMLKLPCFTTDRKVQFCKSQVPGAVTSGNA